MIRYYKEHFELPINASFNESQREYSNQHSSLMTVFTDMRIDDNQSAIIPSKDFEYVDTARQYAVWSLLLNPNTDENIIPDPNKSPLKNFLSLRNNSEINSFECVFALLKQMGKPIPTLTINSLNDWYQGEFSKQQKDFLITLKAAAESKSLVAGGAKIREDNCRELAYACDFLLKIDLTKVEKRLIRGNHLKPLEKIANSMIKSTKKKLDADSICFETLGQKSINSLKGAYRRTSKQQIKDFAQGKIKAITVPKIDTAEGIELYEELLKASFKTVLVNPSANLVDQDFILHLMPNNDEESRNSKPFLQQFIEKRLETGSAFVQPIDVAVALLLTLGHTPDIFELLSIANNELEDLKKNVVNKSNFQIDGVDYSANSKGLPLIEKAINQTLSREVTVKPSVTRSYKPANRKLREATGPLHKLSPEIRFAVQDSHEGSASVLRSFKQSSSIRSIMINTDRDLPREIRLKV